MARVFAKAVLALVAAALAAGLVELLLRTGVLGPLGLIPDLVQKSEYAESNWHQPGRDFVWHGQTGRAREFTVASRWNSLGYNDREHAFDKPAGTRRVVVLGDSYVEAVQVPQDRSFPRLLEARLNASAPPGTAWEAIALGWSGTGPKRYLQTLREVGLRYHPDLVVMEFLAFNDVADDSDELRREFDQQMARLTKVSSRVYLPELWRATAPWQRLLGLEQSRLAVLVGQGLEDIAFRRRVAELDPRDRVPFFWNAFRRSYDPNDAVDRAWARGWDETLGHLREAKRVSEEAGAKFLLVRFTDRWRVAPDGLRDLGAAWPALSALDLDFDKDARLLDAMATREGMAWLDLFPVFREQWARRGPLHFASDTHWNELGHEVAAEALEGRVRELGWAGPATAP